MGIIYFPYYDFPWFLHSMHYSHNLSPLLFSSPPPTPTHTLYTALLPIGKFITLKALDGLDGPLIHFHFLTLSFCYFLIETKLLRGPGARGYASLPYLANTLCSSKSVQRFPGYVEASPALPHQPFPCWVSAVPWGSWSPSPALSYSIVLLVPCCSHSSVYFFQLVRFSGKGQWSLFLCVLWAYSICHWMRCSGKTLATGCDFSHYW